jgi:hypothetical protein
MPRYAGLYLLIALGLMAEALRAQEDSIHSKGSLGLGISYLANTELYFNDGHLLSTVAIYRKQKSYFHIGPLWWIDKNERDQAFRGVNFSYGYFPMNDHRVLNFYFTYDLYYQYEKHTWHTQLQFYPERPLNDYYSATIETKWFSFRNQLGYGINIILFKGLYLSQSFSIGIEFYKYRHQTTILRDQSLSSRNSNSGNGTSSYLKFGLGYSFGVSEGR